MEFDFDFNATKEVSTIEKDVRTAELVSNACAAVTTASAPITTTGVSVSTAEPSTPPTTTTIAFEDEDLTIAHTLMKMRSEKSKENFKEKGVSSETATRLTRGVIMKEASETATRPIVPPQQQLNLKDKGKTNMKKVVSRKRAGEKHSEEGVKKQKVEDDAEKEELKAYLEIVSEDDSAITRVDGSDKYYKVFSAMLYDFDRQDVLDLYRLIKERFETTSPEGHDRLL
ncbi:hypothetical protein Tco_0646182 [Tanacetum coccineum]